MNIHLFDSLAAIAIGIGATVVADLYALLVKRVFSIPYPNYCFVGRWFGHMPDGVFRHDSIAAAARKPGECMIGWIAHYAIGITFAMILVLVTSAQWLREPTFAPAVLVGLATVVFPLFVMQPSFGQGIAASKTPDPSRARLRSVMNHAVFGLGLYLSALAVSFVLTRFA